MRPRRLTPPVRRTARRWRTPPALLHSDEAFEGAAILDEAQGPLGVLLFQAARDVFLWTSTPPEEREGLFGPGAGDSLGELARAADPEVQLQPPLAALAQMVEQPADAQPESVALACQQVAHWADGAGLTGSAILFAQGAALALPADAAASYAVGKLARRRAEHARAETWFRRAVALARQSGDWSSYAQAFAGLGNLYLLRGNLPAARRFLVRSLRAARRHSLRPLHANALHDLFVISAQAGQADEAERLARDAFALYPPDHPRLPFLAADVAYFWMENGRFGSAVRVYQALLHHMPRPDDRVFALANVVRAAAGAGDRRLFEQGWEEVWSAVERAERPENAATVLLELARGAATLGEHDRAEHAAEWAARVARERGESRTRLTAEAVLEEARRSRAARARAALPAPQEADPFALDLVRTLNASLVSR